MTLLVSLPTKAEPKTIDFGRILRRYSFAFALVLDIALLIANLGSETGGFGLTQQLANLAPIAIAALASGPSIIGGGFDFTISPLMFLTNCVFVVWLVPHGLGGAISVPIILGLGLGVGALNGLMIVGLRVQPIVVTLAMYFILQGVDLVISPTPQSMDHSNWVQHLANSVGPVPGAVFTIGAPLLIWFGLRFVPFRRLLYALGSNDTTTYSSGVNVGTVRVASYALGGLFAGFGGLALTALVSSTNSANSTEYSLLAIAAIALGGTSLAGGRGGLIGGLLGAASIYLLQNLLANFGVDPSYLQVLYGAMLIVAVVVGGRLAIKDADRIRRGASQLRRHRSVRTAVDPTAELGPVTAGGRVEVVHRQTTFWNRLKELQAKYPVLQIVALIAVFLYGDATLPGLGSWGNIRTILVIAALVGLASGGQTLLILIGGFDLGVAGFIVASALTVTALATKFHLSFGVALLLAVVGSGILGATAGQVCHRYKINPLVVTLAMGTIAVGIVQILNGGLTTGGAPNWLTTLTYPTTKTFHVGIPPTVAIWIVVAIAFGIFLHRTMIGRRLLATGANPRAADYALIDTRRVWIATFTFSAISAALVGVIIAGYAGNVAGNLGDPYLFQSVVAVIVGGTVFGGPGDYTRTCVGALFLTVLTTVLVGHGASAAGEQIIYGVIILLAITIYGRQRALRDRL
jgi:ribose transport system permease protein